MSCSTPCIPVMSTAGVMSRVEHVLLECRLHMFWLQIHVDPVDFSKSGACASTCISRAQKLQH